jgi:TonB family protein
MKSIWLAIIFALSVLLSSASAQRPTPKIISGGILNGKAVSLPKPPYPDAARAVKASGAVGVKVLIDETGSVISAEAVSGHPLLRAASVQAALAAKFSPTQLSGQPVKVSGVITYNFVPSADTPLGKTGLLAGVPASDREKLWGFGFFFSLIQTVDAETIRLIGDEQEFNNILKELSTDLTEDVAEYKPMLEKVSSTDFNIRSEAARDFLRAVRKELNAEQNWQVDVGEQLGLLLGEVLRQKLLYIKTGVAYDANILRTHLQRISDMIAAAPEGATPESKAKFQKIAAFGEVQDLNTDRRFSELIEAIMPLFSEFDDH